MNCATIKQSLTIIVLAGLSSEPSHGFPGTEEFLPVGNVMMRFMKRF